MLTQFHLSNLVCTTSLGDEAEQTKIRLRWKPLATEQKEDRLYEGIMNLYELSHKQMRRSQEGDVATERAKESGSVSCRDEKLRLIIEMKRRGFEGILAQREEQMK